jgi:glycyl-tRNA synthetase beta chain
LLQEDAEIQLYQKITSLDASVTTLFAEARYLQGLEQLAQLRPAVDRFFDEVMVMVDDAGLQNNRLALLDELLQSFRRVADLSRIQS